MPALRPCLSCFLLAVLACLLPGCAFAPPPDYADSAPIVQKRRTLCASLLALLPQGQRQEAAAQQEARWLADTAYRASASIARINEPCLAGWFNNMLVNSTFNLQERGLCWHYQHDLFRELRRRPLKFFRLGCCVRDRDKRAEHHCVYLCSRQGAWPHAMILDAWRYSGRLKVMGMRDIAGDAWEDDPPSARYLSLVYCEKHRFPMEHWARVKSGRRWNDYVPSWTEEGAATRQGQLMYRAAEEGLRRRGGRLTDYAGE